MRAERQFVKGPPSVTLESVCVPSDGIVSREIDGEVIIIPLVAGVGDAEDELYTLNETGRSIWRHLDGRTTLREVAAALAADFDAVTGDLQSDVLGFAAELVRRRMLSVLA